MASAHARTCAAPGGFGGDPLIGRGRREARHAHAAPVALGTTTTVHNPPPPLPHPPRTPKQMSLRKVFSGTGSAAAKELVKSFPTPTRPRGGFPSPLINFGAIVCNRVKRGLYGGKNVQFGNNVSEDGGNKTRRMWRPNAHRKRLYSEILDGMVQLSVTTHVLRSIDKVGGLDNYILKTPPQKLLSNGAMELRERLMSTVRGTAGEEGVLAMLDKGLGAVRLSRADPNSPKHKANYEELMAIKREKDAARVAAREVFHPDQLKK
mmetsp:Transcript_18684/g.46523  ORF Transcript_18684/g.46523 Transcript_18684/m.46523 type:complete len:264 (-) Transcript_18684:147-938(-)